MLTRLPHRGLLPVLLVTVSCAAAGCGGSIRAYTPDSSSARQALDAALAAWQKGDKPDRLAGGPLPVQAHDFQWQAGQVLERYELKGEEPGEGATKRFVVALKLKSSPKEVEARYVLVGRDPVLVYRGEDYARLLNMDNNPKTPAPKRRR
jgi:hypothetical protein